MTIVYQDGQVLTAADANGFLQIVTAAATYAPLTGTGASGTWSISITGNAATATSATSATSATTATTATNALSLGGVLAANYVQQTGATGAVQLSAGTTAQRPTGVFAELRGNSDVNKLEFYNGTTWAGLGGATGGGSDDIFYENGKTVTTNYTITTNKNAMTAGPVTINTGVTVTVPSGSRWVIV